VLLADFGFSQSLIDDIKSFLNTSSDDLDGLTPTSVGSQAFGASPASLGCAGDATKAQQHVHAAIVDMVSGLQGYVDALNGMQNRAYAVEDVTEADLKQKWQRAQSCETPDFTNVGVCGPGSPDPGTNPGAVP
jgi:hypothetical protein